MLDAAPALTKAIDGLGINAVVGRQVSDGITLLQQLRAAGELGSVVVIGLGTNGTFTGDQFNAIMSILGNGPRVVFINNRVPRFWEQSNNAVIDQGVKRYPNARLVDWYDASANHPEFFRSDGFHLQPAGAALYVQLIAQAIAAP